MANRDTSDDLPLALQHILWVLFFLLVLPFLVAWMNDYGHWLISFLNHTPGESK